MPLPSSVEDRVMNLGKGEAVNRGFLDIFRALVTEADFDHSPIKTMILGMYDKDCNLQPGDWAAELHFVIRKVESVAQPEETEA